MIQRINIKKRTNSDSENENQNQWTLINLEYLYGRESSDIIKGKAADIY